MNEVVEKWAAGFWCDRLHVVKGHFKKTKKQYRREGGSHADGMDLALSWTSQFYHDTDILHDTAQEALDALHAREMQKMQKLREKIQQIQDGLNLIDDFEIST